MNLNRAAMLCAVCAMAAIFTGALVTDKHAGFLDLHAILGVILSAGGLVFAFSKRVDVRRCGVAVLVAGAADCILGGLAPALHAFIAPVVFAACVALVVLTSDGGEWVSGDDLRGLRACVLACPCLVLLQIGLGAAYRHKLTGVLPHIAGATLVAGFLLIVCAIAMQRSTERTVRRAAGALLAVVMVQVSLGMTAFLLRMLDAESHPAFEVVSVGHILVGSLTLAASVVFAMLQF